VTKAFAAANGLLDRKCVVVGCGTDGRDRWAPEVSAPGAVASGRLYRKQCARLAGALRKTSTMLVECHQHGDPVPLCSKTRGSFREANLALGWGDQFCPASSGGRSRGEKGRLRLTFSATAAGGVAPGFWPARFTAMHAGRDGAGIRPQAVATDECVDAAFAKFPLGDQIRYS